MIEFIKNYSFNDLMAYYTYWTPFSILSIVYAVRLTRMYKEDLKRRASGSYYHPSLTLGVILWHVLLTVVPGVNLLALVFDASGSIWRWLVEVCDIPLVPERKKPDETRSTTNP